MSGLILALTLFLGEGFQAAGGLGLTAIDDTLWLELRLTPELALGKLGIGLDLPLRYSPAYGLRRADYNTGRDYARLIRYLRWGRKGDPFFFRIGELNGLTFGQGLLVYAYHNRLYEDEAPKVGFYGGGKIGPAGAEAFTGDLGRLGLVGVRLWLTPLMGLPLPMIRDLEWGVSWIRDFDPDERRDTDDGITAYGMDLGLPVIRTPLLSATLYAEAGKIHGYGQGLLAGVRGTFSGLGLLNLMARLEYRQMSARFLPAYFGPFYEVERATKAAALDTVAERQPGIFGELAGDALGKVRLSGTYQYTPGRPHSGILHLEADLTRVLPTLGVKLYYERKGIESLRSLVGLDENSILTGEGRYRLLPFLSLALLYRRTFHKEAPGEYAPRDELAVRLFLEKPL